MDFDSWRKPWPLGLLLFGLFMLVLAVIGTFTGKAYGRGSSADRAKDSFNYDAPTFNWRVARQMRRRGIPVVYYVCPQFWAWRQGRVKLLRKYVDKALVIFPFEESSIATAEWMRRLLAIRWPICPHRQFHAKLMPRRTSSTPRSPGSR